MPLLSFSLCTDHLQWIWPGGIPPVSERNLIERILLLIESSIYRYLPEEFIPAYRSCTLTPVRNAEPLFHELASYNVFHVVHSSKKILNRICNSLALRYYGIFVRPG